MNSTGACGDIQIMRYIRVQANATIIVELILRTMAGFYMFEGLQTVDKVFFSALSLSWLCFSVIRGHIKLS
jgi:hypothetical protein